MKLEFKKWLEMVGTYVVSPKPGKDYNIWGALGTYGVSPKEDPIKPKKRRRKKK